MRVSLEAFVLVLLKPNFTRAPVRRSVTLIWVTARIVVNKLMFEKVRPLGALEKETAPVWARAESRIPG